MKIKHIFFILLTFTLFSINLILSRGSIAIAQVNSQIPERRLGVQKPIQTESRVALVIGNSNYDESPLPNPVNDAKDMTEALRSLAFEVIYKENLPQNDMKRAIREFGNKIKNGGVGLFYYAGHGIQVNGKNYLIPIDATITKEEEVEYESVDVGFVLAQMENAKNRMNIVILDACRNNPFARSFRSINRGLASIDAPSGTLIAYATAPGSVASDGAARNGLYTEELLRSIRMQGLRIEEVFKRVRVAVRDRTQGKQIPWESSSLVGDFTFSGTITGGLTKSDSKTIPEPDSIDRALQAATRGKAILHSVQNAMGGEALRQIKSFKAKYKSKVYTAQGEIPMDIEITVKYPNKILVKYIMPSATVIDGYDGKDGWSSNSASQQVQDLTGSRLDGVRRLILGDLIFQLTHFDDVGFKTQFLEETTIEGKKVYVILLMIQEGVFSMKWKLYVDAETNLIIRISVKSASGLSSDFWDTEELISDYRRVSGIRTPFRSVMKQNGKVSVESTRLELSINPPISDSVFAKPKEEEPKNRPTLKRRDSDGTKPPTL